MSAENHRKIGFKSNVLKSTSLSPTPYSLVMTSITLLRDDHCIFNTFLVHVLKNHAQKGIKPTY